MSEAAPLASPGDDCSVINQDSTDYSLRIAALFAILGASTIGGCLPLITRRAKLGELALQKLIRSVPPPSDYSQALSHQSLLPTEGFDSDDSIS